MPDRPGISALRVFGHVLMGACILVAVTVCWAVVAYRTSRSEIAMDFVRRFLTWDGMTMRQLELLLGPPSDPHDVQGRCPGEPGYNPARVEWGYSVVSRRLRPDGSRRTYHLGFQFVGGRLRKRPGR